MKATADDTDQHGGGMVWLVLIGVIRGQF